MLVTEVNLLLKENSRMSDYKELMEQLDRDRNKLYTPKGMVEVRALPSASLMLACAFHLL